MVKHSPKILTGKEKATTITTTTTTTTTIKGCAWMQMGMKRKDKRGTTTF